jgi:Uma2 family endonuclease
VLLLIEVADTSLEYDRAIKLPLYARRGIPEVWIVNLPEQCVEVYTAPDEQRYRKRKKVRVGSGKTIRLTTLPQVRIPVDEILG